MNELLFGVAAFLMANLALGLVRIGRGPEPGDRLLALLLFGTMAVAVLLLLAYAQQIRALLAVALVLVLLAAIAAIAFAQLPRAAWRAGRAPRS